MSRRRSAQAHAAHKAAQAAARAEATRVATAKALPVAKQRTSQQEPSTLSGRFLTWALRLAEKQQEVREARRHAA